MLWIVQAPFRNQGGFNIIGSGRDKIESPEQLSAAADTVQFLNHLGPPSRNMPGPPYGFRAGLSEPLLL